MKPKPVATAQLQRMNALQRATESFRYVLLSIEQWISPDGDVRQWMKTNTRIAVFIAAPTFMAFPVVTVALWEVESWINSLTAIAGKLIVLPALVLLALISITIVLRIIKLFKR